MRASPLLRSSTNMSVLLTFGFILILLLLYFGLPVAVERFPDFLYKAVFRISDQWGNKEADFICFEQFGLSASCSRNFYLETQDSGDTIGVWHILPNQEVPAPALAHPTPVDFQDSLKGGKPIFIYFHGNSKTRLVPWRINTYKIISELGYHVLTFDYRGYGDSSGRMTGEQDCVNDALTVLRYVWNHRGSSPVIFWGHSLGSGVVGAVVRHLMDHPDAPPNQSPIFPHGIILDAPFTSVADMIMSRRHMLLYRIVPRMRSKFGTIAYNLNVEFDTESNLTRCPVPILIMHAKDDPLVPFHLGDKLSRSLRTTSSDVRFIPFEAGLGYRHNFIHTAPEVPRILRDFVDALREPSIR